MTVNKNCYYGNINVIIISAIIIGIILYMIPIPFISESHNIQEIDSLQLVSSDYYKKVNARMEQESLVQSLYPLLYSSYDKNNNIHEEMVKYVQLLNDEIQAGKIYLGVLQKLYDDGKISKNTYELAFEKIKHNNDMAIETKFTVIDSYEFLTGRKL